MASTPLLMNRRTALNTLAVAMAAAGTSRGGSVGAAPINTGGAHPTHMVSTDILYMNAANMAPAFIAAYEAQQASASAVQRDPSFQHRNRFKTYADEIRARLAAFVGAVADEVAITRNTSESNNLIVNGLALKSGDEVVLSAHNHESNLDAWRARAARDGLVLKIADTPVNAGTPMEVFDTIDAEITSKTRVIAVSHLTNTTGLFYPVEALAERARKANIWLHVDGAQTFGWKRLNLRAMGCHSFTGCTHKWFMGPVQAGLLYVAADHVDAVAPSITSVNYWSNAPHDKPIVGIRKFESVGQRDDSCLAGIAAVLDAHEALGAEAVEERAMQIASDLRHKLKSLPGVQVLGSDDPQMSGPVLRAPIASHSVFDLYDQLWARRKIAITPGAAGLRFSPHIYNTNDEIDEVVAVLKEAMASTSN